MGAQAEGEEPVVVRHEIYLKPGIYTRQNTLVGEGGVWMNRKKGKRRKFIETEVLKIASP